jgi:hypothetical protein
LLRGSIPSTAGSISWWRRASPPARKVSDTNQTGRTRRASTTTPLI